MYKIFTAAAFMTALAVSAQTNRFIYDVEYRKDSASTSTTKENYHLDIDAKEVKYYPRDFFVGDSLVANNIEIPKGQQFNTSSILSHKNGSNQYEAYDMLENIVLKLSSEENQNWKLTGENKKLKNLNLQKATTTWGGRNWTAWFTTDIPFQEGPYKFHGLPGLITELYDDKSNYRFELVKMQKIPTTYSNQFMSYAQQTAVPVDEAKYNATKLNYYDAPVNALRNNRGATKSTEEFFLNDGTRVTAQNMREVNERLRTAIRKYNNPIEKDKAIKYPN